MKRLLFALALFAVLFPSMRQAEAHGDVSIDLFYNNLHGGNWIDVGDYGYCWQPSVAGRDSRWRPYSDGYWAYTGVGWTWVSYEDFGWATYHYGRWARLHDYGWVWVPGRTWGPAWVSWRTGGNYIGWAPLPPGRGGRGFENVYEPRGVSYNVDIEFDIGPEYYNFCDLRYIGEPVLRNRLYAPSQNITYINQTVNVTNITYNNNTVYNYGPDYERVSAYSTRPIQRLQLERTASIDSTTAPRSGDWTKVEGNRLMVSAPQKVEIPEEMPAPKAVKTKVEKPTFETGWMGVNDPAAKAKMQEKFKAEDPKEVPPPQIARSNNPPVVGNPPADGVKPAATNPDEPPKKGRDLMHDVLKAPPGGGRAVGADDSAPADQSAVVRDGKQPAASGRPGKDKEGKGTGDILDRAGDTVRATAPDEKDSREKGKPATVRKNAGPAVMPPSRGATIEEGSGGDTMRGEEQIAPRVSGRGVIEPAERDRGGKQKADRDAREVMQQQAAERNAMKQNEERAAGRAAEAESRRAQAQQDNEARRAQVEQQAESRRSQREAQMQQQAEVRRQQQMQRVEPPVVREAPQAAPRIRQEPPQQERRAAPPAEDGGRQKKPKKGDDQPEPEQ